MIKRILSFLVFVCIALCSHAQVNWVNPSGSSTVSLTLTLTGSGTGSIVDNQSQISTSWNGSSQSGTAVGNYAIGTPITLTVTPTGGSTFNWASVTGSPGCSGSNLTCSFSITATSTATGNFTGSGAGAVPADYFALDFNQLTPPNSSNPLSYGFGRGWDLVNVLWPFVQTKACSPAPCLGGANNAFKFSGVDSLLAAMHTNGVDEFDAPLSRVPTFASSNSTDASCNGGPGQCDIPTDLNTNGTGTDQFFRDWVAAYVAHINGLDDVNCPSGPTCYTKTHAHLVAIENANEPDICKFYSMVGCSNGNALGSFDALARWQWDMYFIVKGDANLTFNVTSVNGSGVFTGTFTNGASNYYKGQHIKVSGFTTCTGNNLANATVTASTATTITVANSTTSCSTGSPVLRLINPYTGETAATVQASVQSIALSGPINTSTVIAGPSYHAPTTVVAYLTAFLYCSGSKAVTSGGSANCVGPGASPVTDYINMHTKPGGSGGYIPSSLWLSSTMDSWTSSIQGAMPSSVDLAKPVFGSEGGFGAQGWCTVGTQTSGCGGPYADSPLNEAAFVAQFYVYTLTKGQVWNVWYDYHTNSICSGGNQCMAAYNLVASAMVGSTSLSCSHATDGHSDTLNPSPGSLYQCPFTLATTKSALWVWDADNTGGSLAGTYFDSPSPAPNNLECSPISATCPTRTQSITTSWNQLHYFSAVDGVSHAACGSTTCSYAVGNIPILIENQ